MITATQQLLIGAPCALPQQPPKQRALPAAAVLSEVQAARDTKDEAQVRELAQRVRARTRGARDEAAPLTGDEVRAGELLMRSFLATAAPGVLDETGEVEPPPSQPTSPAPYE